MTWEATCAGTTQAATAKVSQVNMFATLTMLVRPAGSVSRLIVTWTVSSASAAL